MKRFRKYVSVYILMWKQATDYRFDFLMEFVCTIVPIAALYFLWDEMFRERSIIQGYTFEYMMIYIVIARLITIVITPDFLFDVMGEIQGGEIQHYICKPIDYISYWFVKSLGSKSRFLIWSFISGLIICVVYIKDLILNIDICQVFYLFVNLILSFALYFEIAMIISLLSFWFYEISSWYYTLTFAIEFLSGGLFPISLYPENIQNLISFFPFSYLVYFPVKIIIDGVSLDEVGYAMGILLIWTLAFYVVLHAVWKEGIKHYELIGG